MSRDRGGGPDEPQHGGADRSGPEGGDPGGSEGGDPGDDARERLAERPDELAHEPSVQPVERGDWEEARQVIAELGQVSPRLQEGMRLRATSEAMWLGEPDIAREFAETIENDDLREMFKPPEDPDPPP